MVDPWGVAALHLKIITGALRLSVKHSGQIDTFKAFKDANLFGEAVLCLMGICLACLPY